jgi:PAS domain S-box-containing protein
MSKVLIVDDNQDLTDALVRVLRISGSHSVVTAARGDEALILAERSGFDVALVDVRLPDVSGVELIAKLRELSPTSEVILITGATTVDTALSALRSGAFAFVLKSFRPEELLATVQQALSKVSLVRERAEFERRYRDLVELADVVVVGLDEQERVVFFNSKASKLAEVAPRDAAGRSFLESWVAAEDQAAVREVVRSTREDGKPRDLEVAFRGPGPVAKRRRIRWHVSRAGVVVYGIGIDVTERLEVERRTREREALSAMGELAMNLAHEIRNPLNAAVLQLHLLGKQVERLGVDAEIRSVLLNRAATVGGEIGRLNRMLTEFLELARPRAVVKETVQLDTLIREVLALQAEIAKTRSIVIREQLAHVSVLGEATKLKQVLLNVVVNGLEAMRDGGILAVRTQTNGNEITIEVEDSGPGIADKDMENVFSPFFTTKEAGTGLGLSIVQKLVDQHGGRVSLSSFPGKGTKVQIVLPTA